MEFSPSFPEEFTGKINIMVLGAAPSEEEERVGLPLVDNAGKLLTNILNNADLPVNSLYISNVFWERPADNSIEYFFCDNTSSERSTNFVSYNEKYLKKEWENQIHRLQEEIDILQPDIILSLGEVALWALTGKTNILSLRGKPLIVSGPIKNKYSIVLPTYHPVDVICDMNKLDQFELDILRLRDLNNTPAWDWPNMFNEDYYEAFGN